LLAAYVSAWQILLVVPQSLVQFAISLGACPGEVDGRQLDPMRPVAGHPPLTDPAWLYELKLDGFRLLADLHGREVTLRYRSGHDCTSAFPELVPLLLRLRVARLLLDGEVVAWDELGRPDFDRLGPRLRRSREPKPPVAYHLFDVLALGPLDLRPLPLLHRKQILERVASRSDGSLRSVPYSLGDGRPIAAFVAEHDLEGLVAKRANASYSPGPSSSWQKLKRRSEQEFLVTRLRRDRDGRIDALAIATVERSRLLPHGIVELGAWRVHSVLPPAQPGRAQRWGAPPAPLVVTVAFTGRTGAGRLREPIVKGVRSVT
jgi:bifunctional non-homologous end joining protein LigD